MKRVTAREAFHVKISKHIILVNNCPECGGTGKQGNWDCACCGNEADDPTLVKRGGYWYKAEDVK